MCSEGSIRRDLSVFIFLCIFSITFPFFFFYGFVSYFMSLCSFFIVAIDFAFLGGKSMETLLLGFGKIKNFKVV